MEKKHLASGSKVLVIVLTVIFCLTIAGGIGLTTYGYIKSKDSFVPKVVTISDIKLPSQVNPDLWGLVWFDVDEEENLIYKHSDTERDECNFDPTRPTIIFIHGMEMDVGYHDNELFWSAEAWLDSGYNVAEFLWSQFSDDGPTQGRNKVWAGGEKSTYMTADAHDNKISGEGTLNYSIAECFVAYYLDFMQKIDYKGQYMHFEGLSLGSNTLFAVCNYMLTLESYGLLDAKYLPDRTTFHDAYLDNISDNETFVNWLNRPIGVDGVAAIAADTAEMLYKRGIAAEYFGSSGVGRVTATSIGKGSKLNFDRIIDNMCFIQYDNSYTSNPAVQHISGTKWYNALKSLPVGVDNTDTEANSYAMGPNMPLSFLYARHGAKYTMAENNTEYDLEDDVISSNAEKPKIAGFAFLDANNNGVNDDRLYNRVNGVTVKLYKDNGTCVATATTQNGGYYQFELTDNDIGNTYYIKVELNDGGYTVGKTSNAWLDMNNNVASATKKSGEVTIGYANDLYILNIGLRK